MKNRLIRFYKLATLAVLSAVMLGCAVGQRELDVMDPLPVNGDAATIRVWRTKQICGSYPLNYISVDNRPVAKLAVDQHTFFKVTPGKHTIAVFHSVIDKTIVSSPGPVAIPLVVGYGAYGNSVTETFDSGITYSYLLRSKCMGVDESTRVSIERVAEWPDGTPPAPENFRPPGKSAR